MANASFPFTLSEPTIAREETGESTTSPDTTPPFAPVAAQLMAQGSRTAERWRDCGPSQVMVVPHLDLEALVGARHPIVILGWHETDRHARLPHLLTGQARGADETIAVGEESERHVDRGAPRRGG